MRNASFAMPFLMRNTICAPMPSTTPNYPQPPLCIAATTPNPPSPLLPPPNPPTFFTFLAQAVLAESSILDQVGDSSSFTVIPMVEQPKKAQTSYFLFLDARKRALDCDARGGLGRQRFIRSHWQPIHHHQHHQHQHHQHQH